MNIIQRTTNKIKRTKTEPQTNKSTTNKKALSVGLV